MMHSTFAISGVFLVSCWSIASSVSAKSISPRNVASLLQKARSLEDYVEEDAEDAEGQNADDDYAMFMDYSLKMIKCTSGVTVKDPDTGDIQYNAVVLRLCPASDCMDDYSQGCKEGYGDFVVGLQTFVEAYLDDQGENVQYDDDNFDVENYVQCRHYIPENDDDNYRQDYYAEDKKFYVGPACTDDGLDVKFDTFLDESCYKKSPVQYTSLSEGLELPFSDGGLVSTACMPCTVYDDDGYSVGDMCPDLYESSPKICEEHVEYKHYYYSRDNQYRYGRVTYGCAFINQLLTGKQPGSELASILFVVCLIFAAIVGTIGYMVWWKQHKTTLEKIEMIPPEEDDNESLDHDYTREDS